MSLGKLSIRNPVLVNVIMIAATAYGAFALMNLPREMMPDVSFPWVFVWTNAFGFSPEDTEKLITNKIEKEVRDVSGLDNITSISREDVSFIWLKFETMSEDELALRLQDVRTEVEKVDLPEGAEQSLITNFSIQDHVPMLNVVLSGDISEKEMKTLSEDLRDRILEVQHVAKCQIAGVRDREIWVEVDPLRLESYDLTLSQIMDAVRTRNLDLSAGNIDVGRWEVNVRTVGEITEAEEIERMIVRASPGGDHVRISDLGDVKDTFARRRIVSRFNSEPAITLTVSKKRAGSSIAIIDEIKSLCRDFEEERLPAGAKLSIINDSSVQINEFLGILQNNAILGMVLVILSLYIFIGARNAIFAAIGIPVTFLTTFIFMDVLDINLSGSSLFGLVLVLGMIVDDAIVILENCYRHLQMGYTPREAAIRGTDQVAAPVLSSSLTTIAAFLPLMLMDGVIGEFMKVVPLVVTLALIASLLEAFFVMPSHIAELSKPLAGREKRAGFVRFDRLRSSYVKILAKVLRRRYLVVLVCTALMVLSIPLIWVVGIDMFATEEIPRLFIFADLPEGTRIEMTDETIGHIEEIVARLPDEELESLVANSGLQQRDEEWFFKPSIGQVVIGLTNRRNRERSTDEIIDHLRAEISQVPGIKTVEFKVFENGPPTGAAVEARVRGDYLEELQEVVALTKAELRSMPGVYDVRDDFVPGKREVRVLVDEERAALVGLTVAQVAATLHHAFDGGVATQMRDGNDDIDVVVKYREESRQSIDDLRRVKIATPLGTLVPIEEVARFEVRQGYSTIKHDELKRAITIKADVDARKNSALTVNEELEQRFVDIARRYPGHDLVFRGQFEEFNDAFDQLGRLFMLGLMLMYIVLAGQFKSVLQPLIIFMAIIFCYWGATIGLLVIGSPFNINNLYGLVALAGVAVNDSLVLINFINQGREEGVRRWRSILQAGKLRLRPILLTTITTVIGLLPMALGIGGKSDIWSPLANVMVWGLTIGTVLTLFVIPALYAILGDLKRAVLTRRPDGAGNGRFGVAAGRLLEIRPAPSDK